MKCGKQQICKHKTPLYPLSPSRVKNIRFNVAPRGEHYAQKLSWVEAESKVFKEEKSIVSGFPQK